VGWFCKRVVNRGAPEGAKPRLAPEACLQLALDVPSLSKARSVATAVRGQLARVEAGTPLLLHSGLAAVEALRDDLTPTTVIVADAKICDAGKRIAADAFAAGADVVTAVGAVIDETTWIGILDAAGGGGGRPRSVMVDTVGWPIDEVGAGLLRLAETADKEGVTVEVCIHRPKAGSPPFSELLASAWAAGAPGELPYLVAGKVSSGVVAPALAAGFTAVVVGASVAEAADPAGAWSLLLDEVNATR
jgi:3-hexulose-6-phosphate synthase